MRVIAGVPLGFAIGAVACRLWLLRPPKSVATDLAQPMAVVTYWHSYGAVMWLALFIAIAVASIAYALALQRALQSSDANPQRTLRKIVLASAVALVAALLFPVLFSSDVYAYGAYGAMALHGLDPYAHQVLRMHDPLIRAAIWQWSNPPPVCVYGPLFVMLARAIVGALSSFGVAAQLLGLRVIASLALLACGPLLYAALRGFPTRQRLAAAIGISLNPIAIWVCAEGHNDALMLAVVLAGIAIVRRGYPTLGAFVIAASAAIKAPGLAAAAVLAVYTWPQRSRFVRVVTGAALGIGVAALAAFPFAWGAHNALVPHGHYMPQFSAQYIGSRLVQSLLPGSSGFALGTALVLVAIGALALSGMRATLAGKREGFALLALALWLAIPNPYPWYALWILPVAFACIGTRASWAIVLASLTVVFRYLPDATSAADPTIDSLVTVCALGVPFAVFALRGGTQTVAASTPPGNP